MPTGESLSLQLSGEKTLAPTVRYYPVSKNNCVLPLKELSTDEAYVVSDFELAEELIVRGADSARIAISRHVTGNLYLEYSQSTAGKQLVPGSPFDFKQSMVIVLPTYNERANLEALVRAISRYLVADILIVDDNSPDGTGELADQLSCKHGHVQVLHRLKKKVLDRHIWRASSGRCSAITASSLKWIVTSIMLPGTCPAWYTATGLPTWYWESLRARRRDRKLERTAAFGFWLWQRLCQSFLRLEYR